MKRNGTRDARLLSTVWIVISHIIISLMAADAIAEDYYVIPFDVDPPVVIDGELDDWSNIANPLVLKGRERVTFGSDKWSGDDDLSGLFHLAWRGGGLFLAAGVVDDIVSQPYSGRDVWKGDHVTLWMDLTPGAAAGRRSEGAGQFHVVLSPGNLGRKEGEKTIPPEIYVYRPEGSKQEGGQIAAKKTDNGYVIEAYIPFSMIGIDMVRRDQDADFEVAFSDSDAMPATQETLITFSTEKWVRCWSHLSPVVFGDGNGKGAPPVRAQSLLGSVEIPAGKDFPVEFTTDAIPQWKEPYVFFKARVDYLRPAGCVTNALVIEVNGQQVDGTRLSNRPHSSTMMSAREMTLITSEGLMTLFYSPNFEAVDKDANYALIDGTKACEYEFALGGLVQTGRNTIVFKNLAQAVPETSRVIHIGDVEYRLRPPAPPPPPPKPAPTGSIPFIEPKKEFPKTYSQLAKGPAKVCLTVNGQNLSIESRFSSPDGKWQTGSNSFFSHERQFIEHDEWIEVHDTFKNLTQEDLPIMQDHSCSLGDMFKAAWLGGLKMPSGNGNCHEPQNPTAFATGEKFGIGMLPLNDEFLVHVGQSADNGTIAIKDNVLYLQPGGEYTAEWAIVPVTEPDFWAFTNACRRLRDVNFPLKWCFAFMFHNEPVYKWTDATFKNFVEKKGANFLVKSNYGVRTKKGHPARCTDWLAGPHTVYKDWVKRVHELYPDGNIKTGIYFHCFLDTTEENAVHFKDDRALDSMGNHLNYGGKNAYMQIYIPTLEKGHWGEEIAKVIDKILEIGADGIFWDEFTHSRVDYVYNKLDGCSADIDPKTFKIIQPKGALTLLSKDFRVYQVKRILDAGRPFQINGAPVTRTLLNLKFQGFTETGSITNCRKMLLHSPIALGDHLTERNYSDSYRIMQKALDNGCLYVWYKGIFHTNIAPTYYMYPFTPIELHSGYLIGQERIVTNRSGYFGWGDNSDFEAHIFDRDGKETDEIKVATVKHDGKSYAELRLPEDYYAIIVRGN